jgi:hypothetical protein
MFGYVIGRTPERVRQVVRRHVADSLGVLKPCSAIICGKRLNETANSERIRKGNLDVLTLRVTFGRVRFEITGQNYDLNDKEMQEGRKKHS